MRAQRQRRRRSRVFQELPPPPAADLGTRQPADLVAYGRHDEHGRDVQLAPAGEDGAGPDRGRPDDRIPTHPAAVAAKTARQAQLPNRVAHLNGKPRAGGRFHLGESGSRVMPGRLPRS